MCLLLCLTQYFLIALRHILRHACLVLLYDMWSFFSGSVWCYVASYTWTSLLPGLGSFVGLQDSMPSSSLNLCMKILNNLVMHLKYFYYFFDWMISYFYLVSKLWYFALHMICSIAEIFWLSFLVDLLWFSSPAKFLFGFSWVFLSLYWIIL